MEIKTGYEVYVGKMDFPPNHSHFGDQKNWNMLLTIDGEVKLSIKGKKLTVVPDTLFMIAPGPLRKFTVPEFWQTWYLHFNMDAHISLRPEWDVIGPGVYAVNPNRRDLVALRRVFVDIFRVCSIRRH
ncbi:MAG: hypothetical protein IJJ28_04175, partial [Lentisphaeria bacterium]|nr:hypothetical protein [Lentisphaeria bacterium]